MLISACPQTNAVIISRWHIFVNKNTKEIFPSGFFLPGTRLIVSVTKDFPNKNTTQQRASAPYRAVFCYIMRGSCSPLLPGAPAYSPRKHLENAWHRSRVANSRYTPTGQAQKSTYLNRQEKYFVGVCLEFECSLCIAVSKDIIALETFHANNSVFVSANLFVCPPLALNHFF